MGVVLKKEVWEPGA